MSLCQPVNRAHVILTHSLVGAQNDLAGFLHRDCPCQLTAERPGWVMQSSLFGMWWWLVGGRCWLWLLMSTGPVRLPVVSLACVLSARRAAVAFVRDVEVCRVGW